MKIKKLTLLLAGATLLGVTPATQAQGYESSKKKAGGYDKVALSADEKAEVIANFERALSAQLPVFEDKCEAAACADGCTAECQAAAARWQQKVAANPTAYYAESFAKRPASWDVLTPLVAERFVAAATSDEQRAILLDLVVGAPYKISADLGAKLYGARKSAFSNEHVLSFALRGAEPVAQALREQAEKSNGAEACADIRAAAFFAFRGDAVGKQALVRSVECAEAEFAQGSVTQSVIAAMALERLGKAGLVDNMLARAQDAALAALDEGEVRRAKRLALQTEYFRKLTRSEEGQGKWVELAWMDEKVASHCAEKAPALADADDVFQLIESVSGM